MSTIFAAATPPGRTALSVLRVSGPNALPLLKTLSKSTKFTPRLARLANLYSPSQRLLDTALTIYFQRPHSYTGEDTVELHLHGGVAVAKAVQKAIAETSLARCAEPGEFTKRAFHNGRIGLTQVEGIRDLLLAETEAQRQAAVLGSSGRMEQLFLSMRAQLIAASAYLAAEIDFSEDNGLNVEVSSKVSAIVTGVRAQIREIVKTSASCSEIVKNGVRIALLGRPNAGKSSLVNYLAQRAVSLVSDVPGTTRDVLEVSLDLNGNKAVLYDTAGVHETHDAVEKLGIDRARAVVENADIVIQLEDPADTKSGDAPVLVDPAKSVDLIRVSSKCDARRGPHLCISTLTGEGVPELIKLLSKAVSKRVTGSEYGLGLSLRAQNLFEQETLPGIDACLEFLSSDVVLAQAELMRAVDAIARVCGRSVTTTEMLDVLFSEFCIGK